MILGNALNAFTKIKLKYHNYNYFNFRGREILRNLDTKKADKIPARLLKETAEEIATSLKELYNKSLQLRTLPRNGR